MARRGRRAAWMLTIPPLAPGCRCEALGDLYYSTGGQFWDQTAGWNRAADGLKGPQECVAQRCTHARPAARRAALAGMAVAGGG